MTERLSYPRTRPQYSYTSNLSAAVTQVTIAFLGALAPLCAQVSPGPLSRAHHSLDSPLKCASCHSFGAGSRKLRCLTCHQEIRLLIAQREGYHGRAVNAAKGDLDCARCHTEHYGENFQIFQWPKSKAEFDHRTTGYVLQGRHTGLSCEQCHTSRHIAETDRKRILVKDLNRTFEGLHPACLTCHEDRHNGQLGTDCERCHDFTHWKPVRAFDHSQTRYPLTGRHQDVTCVKCHQPSAADPKVTQYKGLNFATCTGCHQDPHRAAFSARCDSCHNTDLWRRVSSTSAFDHNATKFPLNGKHAEVPCLKCHRNSNFKRPVAHDKCMDCHQDQHKGQFQHRADHGECGVCHTDAGWRPSIFSEVSHRDTAYPLAGKHQGISCAKCHQAAGVDTNYHPVFKACLDCHRDPHGGQFASAPRSNRCEGCHDVMGFHPSLFSLTQHQSTSFALKGAHAAVACADCHRKEGAPPGADRQFHFANQACTNCHRDPHSGEFPAAMKAGLPAGQNVCEACHNLRSWREVKSYDHSTTEFRLEGSHAALHCADCHRPLNVDAGRRELPFKTAPQKCEGCHEDIHGGQFQRGAEPANCADCHAVTRWAASKFDHNSATTFSLSGAHDKVPCNLCHTARRQIGGRSVVVYKGTPRECAACHR
jgi:predicted CXXCH cytochrome family protein